MDLVNFLFLDLFPTLLELGSKIFDLFLSSIGDIIYQAFEIDLPDWEFLNMSLFAFMLGSGVLIFVGITLVRWVISIIF